MFFEKKNIRIEIHIKTKIIRIREFYFIFVKKTKNFLHSKFQVFILKIVIKQRKIILPTSKKPLLIRIYLNKQIFNDQAFLFCFFSIFEFFFI